MYTKQEIIIQYTRQGKSQRQIASDLGINRRTVKRYIDMYNVSTACATKNEEQVDKGLSFLLTPQKYRCGKRSKKKLTIEIGQEIDRLLSINAEKRRKGLHKQLLKKSDILSHLRQQGHDIGYTTVCNYIRRKEGRQQEAFIRQRYAPASTCEFDWGEVKLVIGDKRRVFQLAVFTSNYSNYRYALLYHKQDTLSFMEAHVAFFSHIGGIFHEMVYDNMRIVVARFVGKHEKEPTRALNDLKGHYRFGHRFCNTGKGNEKGHVERSVEYIRRKAFAMCDTFGSVALAQCHLQEVLTRLNGNVQQGSGRTAVSLLIEEKRHLWELPPPFACALTEVFKVDRYSTISYRGNRYSVPDHLVGQVVEARISTSEVALYHRGKQICTHRRDQGVHQWCIELDHYLSTFMKKPGALRNSEAFLQSAPFLKQLYHGHFSDSPKEFIELLIYCQRHGVEKEHLRAVYHRLQRICPTSIDTAKFTSLLGNIGKEDALPVIEDNEIDPIAAASVKHLDSISKLLLS